MAGVVAPAGSFGFAQGDWQCLEGLASDDDVVSRFTYARGYIEAVAMRERDAPSPGFGAQA